MTTADGVLTAWNALREEEAAREILPCCGSLRWAQEMARARPVANDAQLLEQSNRIWMALPQTDWEEAFRSHPRIGERKAPAEATEKSAEWSKGEQHGVMSAQAEILERLAEGNRQYAERFGRVFLVCATGKSAEEMLGILEQRLKNDEETELREAVEQQRQITGIRLRKWLIG